MILNLMPCVFPGTGDQVVGSSVTDQATRVRTGLAYTAGGAVFLALGGLPSVGGG
jgi:thiol:disulfide interchange protein